MTALEARTRRAVEQFLSTPRGTDFESVGDILWRMELPLTSATSTGEEERTDEYISPIRHRGEPDGDTLKQPRIGENMSDPIANAVPTDLEVGSVYGGEHLKAADIEDGKKFNLNVEDVTLEMMPARDGKPARKKLVLAFAGVEKTLVLSATNAGVMARALGPKPAGWTGSKVVLERTSVQFGADLVPALRIIKVDAKPAASDVPAPKPFQATDAGQVPFDV